MYDDTKIYIMHSYSGSPVPREGVASPTENNPMDNPPKRYAEEKEEEKPRRNPGSPIPPVVDPEEAPPVGTQGKTQYDPPMPFPKVKDPENAPPIGSEY